MKTYEYKMLVPKGPIREQTGETYYSTVQLADVDALALEGWRVVSVWWRSGGLARVLMERERDK